MLELFPAEKMNAYPISRDIDLPGSYSSEILKPIGERLYSEVEQKFIPQRRYGPKQKGTSGTAWGGNVEFTNNG